MKSKGIYGLDFAGFVTKMPYAKKYRFFITAFYRW